MTSNPKTAAKAAEPKVEQKADHEPVHEPEHKPEPKAAKADGPAVVKVAGSGTVRLRTAKTVRRVARGKPVEVTPGELAYLERAGIEFTTEK